MCIKISIIVPVYNIHNNYLIKCINSILNQDYKNIEVILINDGSSDDNRSILNDYASRDNRIILINRENRGVGYTRNEGIDIATGEWLAFVDADDWLDKSYISCLVNIPNLDGYDIVMCNSYVYKEGEFFKNDFLSHKEERRLEPSEIMEILSSLVYDYNKLNKYKPQFIDCGVPWGKIYKTSFLRNKNIRYCVDLKRFQDNVFNLYCFNYAKKIYYNPQNLYYYRIFNESVSNKPGSMHYKYFLNHLKEVRKFMVSINADRDMWNHYYYKVFKLFFFIHNEDDKETVKLINESMRKLDRSILTNTELILYIVLKKIKYSLIKKIRNVKKSLYNERTH